jgi:hypothetical protein
MMLNDRCGFHKDHPENGPRCETCTRLREEEAVAKKTIQVLLDAGYEISVFDCEEFTLEHSRNAQKIFEHMFTTDDDRLYVRLPGEEYHCGWVWFVYGNSGYEVIADYTTNLENEMEQVSKFAEQFA